MCSGKRGAAPRLPLAGGPFVYTVFDGAGERVVGLVPRLGAGGRGGGATAAAQPAAARGVK